MECDDLETIVKVIVVGNGGVGKSSLTARYCKGTFTSTYKKTIGVDFLEKTLDSGLTTGESVKLMIWDTAGQEEFDSITASYYRGAGACAIVFSSTDRASFEAVERWKQKVEAEFEGKTYPILCLVQNKADLIDTENGGSGNNAQMSAIEVESLAKRLNMRLFRTSVKLDTNVKDVFEHLATEYILRSQTPPMVSKQYEEKTSDTKSGSISSSSSTTSSSNLNNSSSTSSLSSSVSSSAAATTTTTTTTTTISSSVNKDKSLGVALSTSSTNTASGGGGVGGGLSNALLPPDVLARVNESNGLPAPAGTIRLGSSSDKSVRKKKTGLFGGC
jgi:Ras-related protein Rab-23